MFLVINTECPVYHEPVSTANLTQKPYGCRISVP